MPKPKPTLDPETLEYVARFYEERAKLLLQKGQALTDAKHWYRLASQAARARKEGKRC